MNAHSSQESLRKKLEAAEKLVTVGATYKHYKGSMYILSDLGIDEASEGISVVYQALYDEQLTFIRPISSWIEMVEVGDKKVSRFTEI